MKKLMCLFVFLLPAFFLSAQTTNVDSLTNLLNTKELTAEEQFNLYKELCAVYKDVNSDSLKKYAWQGMALAEKEKNEAMLTVFYRYAGISCFQSGEYDEAASYLAQALKLAQKRNDKEEEAAATLATGYMYSSQSNVKMMIEYQFKALTLYEALDNKEKMMEALASIGDAYRRAGNTEKAIEYLNKAKDMTNKSNNAFLNAIIYYELGEAVPDINHTIEYELKAVEYARIANDLVIEILAVQTLAGCYLSDEALDYDKALLYAKESYRLAKEKGSNGYVYYALVILSNIYREKEDYKSCEAVSLEALAMDSTNLSGARSLARNIAIANIYLGNKEKAKEFLMKYEELTKEYTAKNYHKETEEIGVKYETEKKEIRIAALEKEKRLYAGLGIAIAAALLLGLGLLFYRHRLSQQKQKIADQQIKQLEQEKELVATQAALEAETLEREIIARDLHDGVGAMLSVVKNNMNIMKSYSIIENEDVNYFNKALDGLDQSIAELRRVAHHIMPGTLLESGLYTSLNDFCHSIPEAEFHVTEPCHRFDTSKELVIYRCAYELVNNALKHAKASSIEVHLSMDEKTVYLSVVDNGCGFNQQTAQMGMGINNLRKRLAAFGGRMDIFSEPGKGTEVNVELKIA